MYAASVPACLLRWVVLPVGDAGALCAILLYRRWVFDHPDVAGGKMVAARTGWGELLMLVRDVLREEAQVTSAELAR